MSSRHVFGQTFLFDQELRRNCGLKKCSVVVIVVVVVVFIVPSQRNVCENIPREACNQVPRTNCLELRQYKNKTNQFE